jgi:hypothetical protein
VTETSKPNPVVMVSSTARDLPEHREKVMHACLRQGMFHPEMMEHLSAADANAVEVSPGMVERADIYLGVFGFRYGYVPPGADISITEMEYDRAVERGIPRLIFLMHGDHPLKANDVETGAGLLRELGAGEPEMPAFDESKFEPMPEVEIDPADEFGAGSEGEG